MSSHLSIWKAFHCLSPSGNRDLSSVGASGNFSDFQAAYSVVKYDDCCFLHSLLCSSSVALLVRVHVTSAERGPLPVRWIWQVFARNLADTVPVPDWPLTSDQAPDVWLRVLVSFGGSRSSFFLSSPGLWREVTLNCSALAGGVKYFCETVFLDKTHFIEF